MVDSIKKEEEEDNTFIVDDVPMVDDTNPMQSLSDEDKEEVPIITSDRSPEYMISQLADESSYDTANTTVKTKDHEKKMKAAEHIVLKLNPTAEQAKDFLRNLDRLPTKTYTSGEGVAEGILKDAPTSVKKDLGEEIDLENTRRTNLQSGMKNLGIEGDAYEAMSTPNPMFYQAAQQVSSKRPLEKKQLEEDYDPDTFNGMSFLEFINPIGGADPEGMDIDWWQSTKDIFSGDFEYDSFNTKMESNYGEDWEWRFSGFLVKEGLIDAAILIAAMSPFSPIAFALTAGRAGMKAKVAAAAARSVVIGVGGGGAQAYQNVSLGRDANFTEEAAIRTVGALGGEALFAGARGAANLARGKFKQADVEELAKLNGKKPIANEVLKEAYEKPVDRTSLFSAIATANLTSSVNRAQDLIRKTTLTVLEKESMEKEVLEATSHVLGMPVKELENLPFDHVLSHAMKFSGDSIKNNNSLYTSFDLLSSIKGHYQDLTQNVELFYNTNGLAMRNTQDGIARPKENIFNSFLKGAGIAENASIAKESAPNLFAAKRFADRTSSLLKANHKAAMKGLSTKEKKIVYSLIAEGDAKGKQFNFKDVNSDLNDVPKKVQEAYAKMRFNFDIEHMVRDASAVQTLKGKVFKLGNKFVRAEKAPKGQYKITGEYDVDTQSVIPNAELPKTILGSKLKDFDTIIPYRPGYSPRVYRNQNYSVALVDPKGKRVSFEAQFDDLRSARDYMKRREPSAKKEGNLLVEIFNKSDTGMGGFHMKRQSMDIMASIDEGTRTALDRALIEAGVDEKNVRMILRNDPNHVTSSAFKGRTDLGIAVSSKLQDLRIAYAESLVKITKKNIAAFNKGVKKNKQLKIGDTAETGASTNLKQEIKNELTEELTMTDNTAIEYYQTLAHKSGHSMWLRSAVDHFEREFGDIIEANYTWNTVGGKDFSKINTIVEVGSPEQIPVGFKAGADKTRIKEAVALKNFIQRFNYKKSRAEGLWDQSLTSMADDLATKAEGGSRAASGLLKVIEKTPYSKNLQGIMRSMGAVPKLLLFNLPHTFIQISQAIPTMGSAFATNPVLAFKSLLKMPGLISMSGDIRMGKSLSKEKLNSEIGKTYKAMKQSGFLEDLNTSDIAFNAGSSLDKSVGSVISSRLRQGYETTIRYGSVPFKLGEAGNRASSFVVVRDQYIDILKNPSKYKNTTIPSFNGVPLTKSQIDSPEFLDAVVDKAKILALDMGKTGELQSFSGFGSVLFQFKQVLPKQASMFNSTALTGREKMGAAAALVGFWGGAGLPLAADLINLGDYILSSMDDDPSKRYTVTDHVNGANNFLARHAEDYLGVDSEAFKVWTKRGAIAAMTDDEVNVISRVALGNFLTDMVDVQEPLDLVVSIAVARDLYEAVNSTTGLGLDSILTVPWVPIAITGRVLSGQDFKTALKEEFTEVFEEGSTARQYLDNSITLGQASLEATRQFGRVASQLGAVSRVLDATHRELINPEAYSDNPLSPDYYLSSSLNPSNIRVNPFRNFIQSMGFTPGKIVDQFNLDDLEMGYTSAATEYNKQLKKDFKRHQGDKKYINRRITEHVIIMSDFAQKMLDMGLDVKVVNNPKQQAINIYNDIIYKSLSGGEDR